MTDEPTTQIAYAELERLRRIEEAARAVMAEWPGKRSATPFLHAMAQLRAALQETPGSA